MSTLQQQQQQQQVFDLNDLEDDLLESASHFDLESVAGESLNETVNSTTDLSSEAPLTLESILNEEEDDFDTDELLRSFQASAKVSSATSKTQNEDNKPVPGLADQKNHMNQSQYTSLMERNGCVCKLANLKQISTQLVNAIERSDSGMPTAMAVAKLIAVGTSRGLILLFDALQVLKLYITTEFKDAVSALSFNNKCDRLLVGNATGMIFMFDATNGKCLRTITDAHPNGNAVLNLKFTDDSKLAVFSDSGGSVFMLEFKRVMGVRGANSTCLFSGSRGEVCIIEPLKFEMFSETLVDKLTSNNSSTVKKNLKSIQQLFNKYTLLAMASFTKVFVVTLRPKLTVLFTFPLTGNMKYLPIVNWQLVIVQRSSTTRKNGQKIVNPKRFVSPILACARESTINYFQVDYYQSENDSSHTSNNKSGDSSSDSSLSSIDFKFIQLQKSEFNYNILNFCWLNAKTLAILDEREKIHICDIRTNEELQVLTDLSAIQLTYNSTFFKSLATGGYVSKALAYAGENACYNTIQSYLGQFFMLGTRSVVLFSLQTWSTRIDDFVNDNSLDLALDLALNMFKGETKALIGLPIDTKSRKEKIIQKIIDVLYLYVNRAMNKQPESNVTDHLASVERHYKKCSKKFVDVCIEIGCTDILFNNLYNLICCDQQFEGYFLESLEGHILQDRLTHIPASILKNFIEYYAHNKGLMPNLELCLLKFEIESLDLHNLIQLCKRNRLLDAFIHLYNKALSDFITPIEEIIEMIYQPLMFLSYETASLVLKQTDGQTESIDFFNKLLVYVHVCLCGQSYPYGVPIDDLSKNDSVRRRMFDYLTETRNQLIDRLLDVEKQNANSPLATKYTNDILDPRSNLGNYPILRIFLNFSTLDFLNVISMSFNEPSFEAVIGLDRKQHLIDILIEIGLNSSGFNYQLAAHLFTFLARQIANENNNIKVDDMIFSQIIEYLCSTEEQDRTEEREQTLLALLKSPKAAVLHRFNADRLLTLSLKAKFYRTCEILYETRGQHGEIIECYLNPENSLERQNKIFDIIRGIMQNKIYNDGTTGGNVNTVDARLRSESFLESKETQIRQLQKKLITYEAMSQMISINPCECIFLLWIEMNTDLKYLINTIKNFSAVGVVVNAGKAGDYSYYEEVDMENELQMAQKEPKSHELLFKFMKGLFDLAELIKPDRKYIYFMSQLTSEHCELYIDLVCVYDPDKILSVFQMTLSDYAYSIDECLRICRKRKVWEGAAYLLEKSGQIKAAFDLKSEKLCGLIREVETRLVDMTDEEVVAIRGRIDGTLVMSVQLCQRNSQALDVTVKEKLWFSLFDEVMRPIQTIQDMESDNKKSDKLTSDSLSSRLDETRLFFKNLGSYLINSMMGYLSLTTIIDRIICDPMYGASNFGDIRHLMIKMLDVCAYEQILLTKTGNLVSQDVYSKMATYKRYSSRSFTAQSNFCHLCSKPLEPTSLRNASIKSNTSMVDPLPLDLSNQQSSFEVKPEANGDISVCIFHCGHSFHESCLEINGPGLGCPMCNLKGIAKAKKSNNNLPSPRTTSSPIKSPTKAQSAELGPSQVQSSFYNRDINFSARQLSALKSIRSRKASFFILNGQQAMTSHKSLVQTSNIQRQSKLKLAPANLCKFVQ